MKLSQLNDYIQTLATIGAIAGLLLVAYEVRLSTRIALAESYRDGANATVGLLSSGIESGISGPVMKAVTQPEALTPEEKMNISMWLLANVVIIGNEYGQIYSLDVDVEEQLRNYDKTVELIASRLFSSAWSRAWFYEREWSLSPRLAEVIRRTLEKTPLNSQMDEYERIDEKAAAIE